MEETEHGSPPLAGMAWGCVGACKELSQACSRGLQRALGGLCASKMRGLGVWILGDRWNCEDFENYLLSLFLHVDFYFLIEIEISL